MSRTVPRLAPPCLAFTFALNCAGKPPAEHPEGTERPRARELGIAPGRLAPGEHNAITDVAGVRVGHVTLMEGEDVRTGVTAVLPHGENVFREKVPAAIAVKNGFGKLVGYTQVRELGQLETPILLTNTLAVWDAAAALVALTLEHPENAQVRSVNPVVGETNDGWLNEIRKRALDPAHFRRAVEAARPGPVEEGSVGAGAGTRALGFKGGIGTSSRALPEDLGGYTVGALVQTNFGGRLTIQGFDVSDRLGAGSGADRAGSCMILLATDAPLSARQLGRLARRAFAGMARTGASFSHGSGDYAIAFSTAEAVRIPHERGAATAASVTYHEAHLSPLFEAAADATEEAILNSLLRATTVRGRDGHEAEAIPVEQLRRLLEEG